MMRGGRLILYLVVGSAAFIWLVKVPILSWFFSDRLGFPVFMEWVSIWPTETTIGDLRIHNFKEADVSFVFEVRQTKLAYHWKEVFANLPIIDRIHCDQVGLFYPENQGALARENEGDKMSVLIRTLILTNMDIVTQEGGIVKRHVDRLELHDIASGQVLYKVFEELDIE